MCLYRYDDSASGSVPESEPDPEPEEPGPAGPLYVPVRPGPAHAATLRLFRTAPGIRTAVGFTDAGLLAAVLGADEPWIVLSEPALRALAEAVGVTRLTLDPVLCPHPVRTAAGAPRGNARAVTRAA